MAVATACKKQKTNDDAKKLIILNFGFHYMRRKKNKVISVTVCSLSAAAIDANVFELHTITDRNLSE